jgi:hypothetical protein
VEGQERGSSSFYNSKNWLNLIGWFIAAIKVFVGVEE